MGVGEGQAQACRHICAFVTGTQKPDMGHSRGDGAGADAGKDVLGVKTAPEVAQHVGYLLGEMADVSGAFGVGQGRVGQLVASWGASDAQVDAPGIERLQHSEVFRHLERAVMGKHHAAAAHPDGLGAGGHLSDQYFRAGPGEVGDAVVLSQPIPLVS